MSVGKQTRALCIKNLLIRACYWYYVKAEPIMSDREYDREFLRLQNLERKIEEEFDIAPDKDSPTQKIWGDRDEQYPDWAKELKVIRKD